MKNQNQIYFFNYARIIFSIQTQIQTQIQNNQHYNINKNHWLKNKMI
jgi:hypothetical protein